MCICKIDYSLRDLQALSPAELQVVRHVLAKTLLALGPLSGDPMPLDAALTLADSLIAGDSDPKYTITVTFRHHGYYASVEAWVAEHGEKVGIMVESARRKTELAQGVLSKTLEVSILNSPGMEIKFMNYITREAQSR